MNKKTTLWLGILLVMLLIIGMGYLYITTIPSQSDIDSAKTPIENIDRNILSNKTIEKLQELNMNGSLPYNVDEGSLGNNNPF